MGPNFRFTSARVGIFCKNPHGFYQFAQNHQRRLFGLAGIQAGFSVGFLISGFGTQVADHKFFSYERASACLPNRFGIKFAYGFIYFDRHAVSPCSCYYRHSSGGTARRFELICKPRANPPANSCRHFTGKPAACIAADASPVACPRRCRCTAGSARPSAPSPLNRVDGNQLEHACWFFADIPAQCCCRSAGFNLFNAGGYAALQRSD